MKHQTSRKCACGCGAPIFESRHGRPKKYYDSTHAAVAYKNRKANKTDKAQLKKVLIQITHEQYESLKHITDISGQSMSEQIRISLEKTLTKIDPQDKIS